MVKIVSNVWLPTLLSGAGMGFCYSPSEAAEVCYQYKLRCWNRGQDPEPVTVRTGGLTEEGEFIEKKEAAE